MTPNNELFQIKLEGENLIKAVGLKEMSARLQVELDPIRDQAKALAEQLEALEQQMEEKCEAFDKARVSLFRELEESLGIDVDATSLNYEEEDAQVVYLQRTQQDIDRKEALQRVKGGNPLGALMAALAGAGEAEEGEFSLEEATPCDNPSCSTCAPLRSVH